MTEKNNAVKFKIDKINEKNNKFFFTAISLTEDFECEKGLKRLAKDSINKPLVWRHTHPIQKGNKKTHIYGKVVDSYYKNGKLFSKYQVYGHTPSHQAIRELIRERNNIGNDLGISMHYRTYLNSKGEKIHFDVFEMSSTPFPKCEECENIEYIGESEKTMTNEEKSEEKSVDKDEELENEKEEELEEHLSRIDELEQLLNSKTSRLENYKTKINELEGKMENEKETKMTLEDKVNELEKRVDYLKKKPIIDQIYELEKRDSLLDYYKNLSVEELKNELEKVEDRSASTVQTKELNKTAEEADVDEGMNEKEEVTMKEFMSHI